MTEQGEKEKMLAGAPYDSRDPALLEQYHQARALLARLNATPSTDAAARRELLTALLGRVGDGVWVETPFYCDYGAHLTIGADSFVNVNCVFLDCNRIDIGANALIGPNVQIYTAFHPVDARARIIADRPPGAATSPYVTQTAPVCIGDRVWIGGSAVVMPGVTIGDNVTIGAGSLVTRDVPSNVLAVGQPCKVIRSLD